MATNYKLLVGIDPGKSGGIASMLYNRDTQHGDQVKAVNMPANISDFDQYIKFLIAQKKCSGHIVMIEKIQMFTGSAQKPAIVMRMQKLLANYNKLVSCMEIAGIRYIEATPMEWQRFYKTKVPHDRSERKRLFKSIAARRFKMIEPTLATADALCLLDYLRCKYNLNKNILQCPIPTNLF